MTDLNHQELVAVVLDMQAMLKKLLELGNPIRARDDDVVAARGLPNIEDMSNLEITFFDNLVGKPGKSRHTIKAEFMTDRVDFRHRKSEFADLHALQHFEVKLRKRTISDEYRAELKTLIDQSIALSAETMIGMFSVKGGGVKGTHWLEHQYIIILHNGEYKPLDGFFKVNGVTHVLDFRKGWQKHPITGKPYAADSIKAKSITMPRKEILALQEEA